MQVLALGSPSLIPLIAPKRQGDGSLVSCIQPDVAANKLLVVYDAAHEYYGI